MNEIPAGASPLLVRPYTVTGGRTRPKYELAIEALVSSVVFHPSERSDLAPEHQIICQLCQDVRSVAEIAAHLEIPLGVARVLVADMAEDGLVRIHQPAHAEGQPDRALLERVLSGLRNL